MRVSFFVPPGGYFAERWSHGTLMPALGILYMGAMLEQQGHQVEVTPSHVLEMTWRDIARKIETDRPDVVGITTTTENRFLAFELAEVAKAAHPGTFVLMGGPHFKNTAEDTLRHLPAVDGVCVGEGEMTVLELVRCLEARDDLRKVNGLVFRQNGHIVHNAPRGLIPDLNTLPLPARHLEPFEKYRFRMDVPGVGELPAANLMTSRGCPFTCNFCATPANWGTNVRGLTPANVVREIEHVMERYGARAIWFYDDTFNYKRQRTFELMDLMIERKLGVRWYAEVRVDIMTRELFVKMVEAGCFNLGFGIETANQRIARDVITKRATLKQAFDVIDWCNEYGVIASPGFIFSHPTETWEEAQETIEVIERLKDRAQCGVSILHIYPGIALEKQAIEEGRHPKDFSWTRKRDTRVIYLPAAQGHVPLYQDRLSWWQISELIFRFAESRRFSIWRQLKKVPQVLASIYSWADVKRYAIMFLVFCRLKAQRMAAGKDGRPPSEGQPLTCSSMYKQGQEATHA
ncbi:MAG: B12-binding domain-containing radical SAM protein [Candidatus Rokuibacteriota bacterium]